MTNLGTLDYVENFTVSKSISDRMWRLTFTLDKDEAPLPLTGIRVFATDHNAVEHCIFIGVIPGAQHIRKTAADKVSISAYDFTWYLTVQTAAEKLPLYAKINAPLLGNNILLLTELHDTGLELCHAFDIETTCPYPGYCKWTTQTTKMQAIEDMCRTCNKCWWIRFKETSPDVYSTCITCVSPENVDDFIPTMVTFTNPSDYVVDMHINVDRAEQYNRIIVYGTDPQTGDWYTKTEETAGVTAEEEKPIEYVFEDSKLTSQAKVDAKATELYAKLHTTLPDTYTATLTNRYDLELLQKVKFMGYTDIPEVEMRIVAITYQRQLNDDKVIISFTQEQPFSDFDTFARAIEPDSIQTQEQVIRENVRNIANILIGTVTEINGNIATITLERGESIQARILV